MGEGRDPAAVVRDVIAFSNEESEDTDVFAENIEVHNPGLPDGVVHSREAWIEYHDAVVAAFPDVRFEVIDMVVGDGVVLTEMEVTGTHRGEFKGVPATGRRVTFRFMDKYVVEDGRVTEWYTYYDTAELQSQLGLTFPEVLGQFPTLAVEKLRSAL